jgi:hypothetical protein
MKESKRINFVSVLTCIIKGLLKIQPKKTEARSKKKPQDF